MKIKVARKKSSPIRVMEVGRKSSARAKRCKGFTNIGENFRLPKGILLHHTTTRISNRLPDDILFYHIFVRLSTTALLCCKSVCKGWNRVIRDPQFVRHHLNQKHHKLLLKFPDNRFNLSDCEQDGIWFHLPPEVSSRYPQLLGSSNGLVGLSLDHSTFTDAKVLSIWNPSIGEFKLIPDPYPYIRLDETLGFAYDPSFDDYKFVHITNTDETCRMDAYSLRNNSWKLIKEAPPHDSEFKHFVSVRKPGVGLNGYLYWLVADSKSRSIDDVFTIELCLREYHITVAKLPLEIFDSVGTLIWTYFGWGLIAMGNCLAVYVYNERCSFVVWTSQVSEKNEERQWEKLIDLSFSSSYIYWARSVQPVWLTKDGKVVLFIRGDPRIGQEQHRFGLYDPLNKSIKLFQMYAGEYKRIDTNVLVTHTESLLSPNMFGGNVEC